ncbi:MAG: hypothetical protein HY855_11060 [Burkholderiales bacterium]|nr:hypothetical protein [Burkholderiales bacterium]
MSEAVDRLRRFVPRWLVRYVAWPRRITAMGEFHGVWGPGVRVLRNMPLQTKAWLAGSVAALLLLVLMLDVAGHRVAELRAADQAVSGVAQVRAVTTLRTAMQDLTRAMFRAETGMPQPQVETALAAEAQAFVALRALAQPQLARQHGLRHTLDELVQRRDELLALRQDASSGAPGSDGGPRLVASRRYGDALVPVRTELIAAWANQVDEDLGNRMLREGLVNLAHELSSRTHRLVGQGLLGMASAAMPVRERVGQLVHESRTVQAMHRPMLERARAVIPERASQLDDELRRIERLQAAAERVARLPAEVATPEQAAAALGMDSAAYGELGTQAMAAVRTIETMGLETLAQRLTDRRSQLLWTLGLEALVWLLGLAASIYVLVCTYKVIAGGLAYLCEQVGELGHGNLAIRPTGHGRDEIGQALNTLSRSAAQMSSLFAAVTQGVAAVSHASREVATGNAGLSHRTGDIREAIGTVADRTQAFSDAMERCTQAVDRAAEHVRTTRLEAQRSRKAMAGLHQRMRTLQGKSHEIGQVVSLVESVAYQTKLLAINASVEAARAGPAGKGFAVVAQEVRALAQRSEMATRRIQAIVDASIVEIDEGNLVTERAGAAVRQADVEIEAVSRIMGEIVNLVHEGQTQSRDVLGITRDVEQAAGGNAKLVDQLSEASAGLRDQGDALKRSVRHFEFG